MIRDGTGGRSDRIKPVAYAWAVDEALTLAQTGGTRAATDEFRS